MGCTPSVYAIGKKKKKIVPEISIFVPVLRIPRQSDLQRTLRGLIPKDLADRITSLRNQIVLVAEDTGGAAISELIKALEEYLSLLLGLTKKEYGLQDLLEFRWKELEDGGQEICVANSWFELLCVLHMMATLMLMEANEKLIPKQSSLSERVVSADCMRDAVDLLLKAAGYLHFCVRDVLLLLPPDIKNKLPSDMQGNVLEAISHQALAQGTEIQLGLAVQSQNATLSVKRRLACEQLSYFAQDFLLVSLFVGAALFSMAKQDPSGRGTVYAIENTQFPLITSRCCMSFLDIRSSFPVIASKRAHRSLMQCLLPCFDPSSILQESTSKLIQTSLMFPSLKAYCCLSEVNENNAALKKQLLFLKWKHLEAKAAAYYYHGLIVDKGNEPSSHVSAVCCFLAAEELLAESKKACLTFCLAVPITRSPPPWGAMKHLHKKIPETASKKSQTYGYLLDQEKGLQILPDLPEFQLSLKPDDYELPELDPAWDCGKWEIPEQTLKEHLNEGDCEPQS